jgi:phosphinothricin acetyltransferase
MAINIRLATAPDAADIRAIYAPIVRETFISFETDVPTELEMGERIRRTVAQYPWLVADDGGTVAGYAYAGTHRTRSAYQWAVDVSAYVRPEAQRRGIGSGLYTALFALLAQQGYVNAYAGIALPNPASVGLHESLGFEPVGVYRKVGYKLGAWHDVGWWGRALQAPPDNPAPPRPVTEIIGNPGWKEAIGAGERMIRS